MFQAPPTPTPLPSAGIPGRKPAGEGEFTKMMRTPSAAPDGSFTSVGSVAVPGNPYAIASGRFNADTIPDAVTANEQGSRALDVFAGTGFFSLPLAQRFERVTAVENAPPSFRDLEHNAPANLRPIRKSALEFLTAMSDEKFDLVVVDPPRAGLGEQLAKGLSKLAARRLTYVSCDPATLARDLQVLLSGGYQMTDLHLVDLFPQTFHIETVVRLVR